MYRLTHHNRRSRLTYLFIVLALGASLLVVGSVSFIRSLRPDTALSQSAPVTHVVSASSSPLQHISNKVFAIDLPQGWHVANKTILPDTPYRWQGAEPNDAVRRIDIYIDTVPTTLAANHLLPVAANGNSLQVLGSVSDNCVNFTNASAEDHATGLASAVWLGINFTCDMGNYERDVVLTGSSEGINTTTLFAEGTTPHRVLFVYTDNSINPDYSIFSEAVKSFQLL